MPPTILEEVCFEKKSGYFAGVVLVTFGGIFDGLGAPG